MEIQKPIKDDLTQIFNILKQWTEMSEVEKYRNRVVDEINGMSEYGMKFWVVKDKEKVVGVMGLSDILPILADHINTKFPIEIKIMYVDEKERKKGVGRLMINFLETKAKDLAKTEILIRSAVKYVDTAWGFYEKMGYVDVGRLKNGMAVFRKLLE